jgi:hypothetical protein
MRAALLLMLGAALGLGMPAPASAQTSTDWLCEGRMIGSGEYADWAGRWEKHGGLVSVRAEGCGIATWRTYRWCLPGERHAGCDWEENGIIQHGAGFGFRLDARDGAAASGHILIVSDADAAPLGGGVILRRQPDETLAVEWADKVRLIVCRAWAWDVMLCGA